MPFIIAKGDWAGTRKLDFDPYLTLQSDDGRRFRLSKSIVRQGGNGVVFCAEELGPHNRVVRRCAVKLLKQLDSTRRDRFANELRASKSTPSDYETAASRSSRSPSS